MMLSPTHATLAANIRAAVSRPCVAETPARESVLKHQVHGTHQVHGDAEAWPTMRSRPFVDPREPQATENESASNKYLLNQPGSDSREPQAPKRPRSRPFVDSREPQASEVGTGISVCTGLESHLTSMSESSSESSSSPGNSCL